jgi:aerobic-type carbon monoxide dehydrogenase small subunit (CoxS/CutS family)
MAEPIILTVNGEQHAIDVDAEHALLDVLRDRLGLTGGKIGCGEGQCGVCTVLVDQQLVRSCVTPVGAVAGQSILTIEGLEQNGRLHPLQQAVLDQDALQCGYCTPGMIMAGVGLLHANPAPSRDQIVAWMQGNLCRCGAYGRIIGAIEQAAAEMHDAATGGQR